MNSLAAKKTYGPDLAYTSAVKTFEEVRSHLGREMNGRWLGAMPVDAFLDKYVPAAKEPLPDLSKKPFEKVPTKGVETSRYDPFVSTVLSRKQQFCDNVRHPDRRYRRMDAPPPGCKHKQEGRHGE